MRLETFNDIESELDRRAAEYADEPIVRNGQFTYGSGRLAVFDLSKLDGPPPPEQEWIVPDYVPAGEITLFTGYGGAGKSLFSQQLATCLASGVPLIGVPIERKRVLYVTAEDSENVLHRRQRAIMARLGNPAIGDRLMLSTVRGRSDNALNLEPNEDGYGGSKLKTDLHNTIIERNADVVILDNIAHLFAGNENDRQEVTKFINDLYGMVQRLNVTILLIGHPNKSGDSYSGSTAWLAAVRSQIELARPDDAEHDPDARVLRLGKANYARAGAEIRFRWHEHAFALDEELPRNVMDEIREVGRMNADDEAFMDCLGASTDRKQAVSHNPGVNYYGKVFPAMKEARGRKKEAFEAAFQRLLSRGEIELDRQLWQRENRVWKYGIRAVDKAADKCTDPLHQTAAPTPSQVIEKPCTDPHAPTPLYTTYIPGAGPDGPPAPVEDDGGWIGESPAETEARHRRAKP